MPQLENSPEPVHGSGPRDSAEYLSDSAGCLDVADANLQMPFAIMAATNEGRVHGDRDR